MTRLRRILLLLPVCACLLAQDPAPKQEIQEPPEEDQSAIPKEYVLNPVQAEKELKTGQFYFKKGSWKAAAGRFLEATRWNPGLAEAHLRLGETRLKLNDVKGGRESIEKYLELAPDGKEAGYAKKLLSRK